jgi:hypothetical protein
MTRAEHKALWQTPSYIAAVERQCAELGCDGCTGVPDFYLMGCLEHDIAYHTGHDPRGQRITKDEADERLRWYIQNHSVLGWASPMAWWRWWAVKEFAGKAWHGN